MRLPPAIRDLFRTEDDPGLLLDLAAGADAPAPPKAGARPSPSDKARLERFESRLRTLAKTGERSGPLVAGRLQIIALSRVKERLGDDWARLAANVHRLTRQILQRRLTDADVYVQAGDRYVILFASLTAIEATFKAQAIAREITALLIGELPEIDETPVRVTIHEIDPGELKGGPSLGALVAQLDHLAAREADKVQDRGPGSPEIADDGPARFEFLPIWSRRGRAVVGYLCTGRRGGGGADPEPYELDAVALRTILASLPAIERHGYAALVVAPIRWDTLVQLQRRPAYLELCRQVPHQLQRRLGFAVQDVAAGAWRGLIGDRLSPLRPFGRFFLVSVPPEPAQLRDLAEIGIDALAFEAAPACGADQAQLERIGAFAREASRQRLATCALGVDDRRAALALLAAGVDFLGGDAVAHRVGAPGAAYRLDLAADAAAGA
jgi:hypothetical protein